MNQAIPSWAHANSRMTSRAGSFDLDQSRSSTRLDCRMVGTDEIINVCEGLERMTPELGSGRVADNEIIDTGLLRPLKLTHPLTAGPKNAGGPTRFTKFSTSGAAHHYAVLRA